MPQPPEDAPWTLVARASPKTLSPPCSKLPESEDRSARLAGDKRTRHCWFKQLGGDGRLGAERDMPPSMFSNVIYGRAEEVWRELGG